VCVCQRNAIHLRTFAPRVSENPWLRVPETRNPKSCPLASALREKVPPARVRKRFKTHRLKDLQDAHARVGGDAHSVHLPRNKPEAVPFRCLADAAYWTYNGYKSLMPLGGTWDDENGVTAALAACLMALSRRRVGGRPILVLAKPVYKSGLDVDTNPGLLPPSGWGARGADCYAPRRPPAASFGGAPWTRCLPR
jgi:hypothetical protein